MKLKISEAGKKIAKRNAAHLKAIKTAVEALMAEVGEEEAEAQEAAVVYAVEETLRLADSMDGLRQKLQKGIRAKMTAEAGEERWPWVSSIFADHCVVELAGSHFQVPYALDGETLTLGDAVEVELAYVPKGAVEVEESTWPTAGTVPLVERAVRADGTVPLKLIDPGWGSSGYYPKEVLERDGPKVFKKGLKMFADHQTAQEAMERPEGSIKDLAAVLDADARWQDNGPDGPGLYADAKVFESWKAPINDMAADIGVSIRASGRAKHGEAEGRKGAIIEAIVDARSVDFVTDAGRGGKILSLSEAAKRRGTGSAAGAGSDSTMQEETNMALSEAEQKKLQEDNTRLSESLTVVQTQLARLSEAAMVSEAKSLAGQVLAGITLPEPTRLRLAESLSLSPVTKDGALDREAFTTKVREAAKTEAAYLAQVTGGAGIRGMGESIEESASRDEVKPEVVSATLEAGFARLGLSESAAKVAAAGH